MVKRVEVRNQKYEFVASNVYIAHLLSSSYCRHSVLQTSSDAYED